MTLPYTVSLALFGAGGGLLAVVLPLLARALRRARTGSTRTTTALTAAAVALLAVFVLGGVGLGGGGRATVAAAALAVAAAELLAVAAGGALPARTRHRAPWAVLAAVGAEVELLVDEPGPVGGLVTLGLVAVVAVLALRSRPLLRPAATKRSRVARRTALPLAGVAALGGLYAWGSAASRLPDAYALGAAPGHADMAAMSGGHTAPAPTTTTVAATGGTSLDTLRAPALTRGRVRTFDVTAAARTLDVPGVGGVDAWTFGATGGAGGTVSAGGSPGPALRVRQGERVVVRLHDGLGVPTSIHWHGLDVPNSQDGVAGLTQDAVRPGASATYTFDATQPGTYWYHAHQDSVTQVGRGLFGTFVVEPPGGVPERVDRVVAVHTWASGAARGTSAADQDGAASAPAAAGERVRVRVVNTDDGPAAVTVTGAPFRVAALDGHDLTGPTDLTLTSVHVPAGGRLDVTYTQPGERAVRVDVAAADGSASYRTASATGAPDPGATPATIPFDVTRYGTPVAGGLTTRSPFTERFTARIASRLLFHDGQLDAVNAINDRVYPNGDMFMVSPGDLVEVILENRSFVSHPMHLHGHTFTVLAHDGRALTGSPVRLDTLQVDPGETWTVGFRADNPGLWMFHCHNLQHAAAGMDLMLGYRGVTTPYRAGPATGNDPE